MQKELNNEQSIDFKQGRPIIIEMLEECLNLKQGSRPCFRVTY
jgi:hypothetical protein